MTALHPHNVVPLRRTDATRMTEAAAQVRRDTDSTAGRDLAALLDAIGGALRTVGRPPLAEAEMWRWSAVVHHARRISSELVPE